MLTRVAEQVKAFIQYLLGKRSEVKDMDIKDVVMAKAILDIHRLRKGKKRVLVPLYSLRPIHRLDRENALAATHKRAEILQENKDDLLKIRDLTSEVLAQHIPSVSLVKVVEDGKGHYLSFEGNGRIGALKEVFSPEDNIRIEVEQYRFRSPRKIIRRLNRVRRLNGFEVD